MASIAFVTHKDVPEITDDDRLASELLKLRGHDVKAQVWSDPDVDWSSYDAVIIRSTWDYHLGATRYASWLQKRVADGTRLWNSAAEVLENLNKRYLLRLEDKGVPIIPTRFVNDSENSLRDLMNESGWKDVVVKPAVSAGAHDTWRISLEGAESLQEDFARLANRFGVIVQPFLPEVAMNGEWSLVYLGGEFSHSVLKRPRGDDYRVQELHGGTHEAALAPDRALEVGRTIMNTVEDGLLYARVDGVMKDGDFFLMEFEINEPNLFLGTSPGADDRFASVILDAI